MASDDNESNDLSPVVLHRQVPLYGWLVVGSILLILGGLAIYLRREIPHEHASVEKFVGPGQCKQCHPKQYESWKQTRMANSFNVLRPGEKAQEKRMVGLDPAVDYTHDSLCLPCHTTGYGLVGGFVSIEKTPEMAGVTCEACHGNGGSYARSVMDPKNPSFTTVSARKAGLVYPPTENVCRECHNAHSPFVGMDYKFVFDERVKLGTHEHFLLAYEHGK
jgi:hypothetical protein